MTHVLSPASSRATPGGCKRRRCFFRRRHPTNVRPILMMVALASVVKLAPEPCHEVRVAEVRCRPATAHDLPITPSPVPSAPRAASQWPPGSRLRHPAIAGALVRVAPSAIGRATGPTTGPMQGRPCLRYEDVSAGHPAQVTNLRTSTLPIGHASGLTAIKLSGHYVAAAGTSHRRGRLS
jgi:hypothetical protein